MNGLQLELVNAIGENAISLMHAPESLHESFDELGCIIPEKWASHRIDIQDDRIVTAEAPGDQAQAVVHAIAKLDGRFAADQITIGLADESLGSTVQRHVQWAGLSVRSGVS